MLTLILICFGMSVNGQENTKGVVFEKEGTLFNDAVKKLDQGVKQGIIHKNKAARKKSQLALKLAKIDA